MLDFNKTQNFIVVNNYSFNDLKSWIESKTLDEIVLFSNKLIPPSLTNEEIEFLVVNQNAKDEMKQSLNLFIRILNIVKPWDNYIHPLFTNMSKAILYSYMFLSTENTSKFIEWISSKNFIEKNNIHLFTKSLYANYPWLFCESISTNCFDECDDVSLSELAQHNNEYCLSYYN